MLQMERLLRWILNCLPRDSRHSKKNEFAPMDATTEGTTTVESNDDASSHQKYFTPKIRLPFPNKMSSRTDTARPQACLGDALNEEYLLFRVLEHLVDDGLHECRRVCRKWRDVCSLLPVKLVDVRQSNFRDAARLFPYATSVSVTVYCNSDELCECISSFTCIKHLHLRDVKKGLNLFGSPQLDIWSLPSHAPFSSQLESLTMSSITIDYEPWIWMLRGHLTNLTHLEIGGDRSIDWENMDPLPETLKLKSLSIRANRLLNSKGMLIFPPSENLTRLEVSLEGQFENHFLEVSEMIRNPSSHEIDRVSRH